VLPPSSHFVDHEMMMCIEWFSLVGISVVSSLQYTDTACLVKVRAMCT